MFKKKYISISVLLLYLVLLVLIEVYSPKPINWNTTFGKDDKIPYGSYILYRVLPELFPNVIKNETPFYNFYKSDYEEESNFIFINDKFSGDNLDIEKLTSFVADGNNVFLATTSIPPQLEDSLGLTMGFSYDYSSIVIVDSVSYYNVNFTNDKLAEPKGYNFKNTYSRTYFMEKDSIYYQNDEIPEVSVEREIVALGEDKSGNPNFVAVKYGEGTFYLHGFPLAFTNYNMLNADNADYISKCLSYLPAKTTYWDDYYKPYKNMAADTPLRFVLSVPAYKWAYYVAIVSLLVYIIFASKRRQRIIPIISPFKNLSLEFANTIGTLYYQQRDHQNLADKKMTYFLEKVRNVYFLPTNNINAAFKEKLSFKSNTDMDIVNDVFNTFERIKVYGGSEDSLIEFNRALEKFYAQTGLNSK